MVTECASSYHNCIFCIILAKRNIARIVEENGGALIAIHGRTKEQNYGGQADWDAIAEVKAAMGLGIT